MAADLRLMTEILPCSRPFPSQREIHAVRFETDHFIVACAFAGPEVSGGVVGFLLGQWLEYHQRTHGLGRAAARTLLGSALSLTLGFFVPVALSQ